MKTAGSLLQNYSRQLWFDLGQTDWIHRIEIRRLGSSVMARRLGSGELLARLGGLEQFRSAARQRQLGRAALVAGGE